MPNSAPQVLLAFLRGKGAVAAYEAVAAVEAAGYRKQVGYQAISKAVKDRTVERIGERQPFSYRLVDDDTGAGEQLAQPTSPPFAASLGVACATAPTPLARPEPATDDAHVDLVAGVFDADIAMTRADVVDQLDGKLTPQEVTAALTDLAHAGRLHSRFDREEAANIYWIVEPDAAVEPAGSPHSAYTPPVFCEPEPYHAGEFHAPEAVVKAAIAKPAAALAERLEDIARDLADAVSDACDAGLPHVLIKALARANDATHRAARSLV